MKIEGVTYRDEINETYITVPDEYDKKTAKLLNKYNIPNYYFNINTRLSLDEIYKRIELDSMDEMFGSELFEIDVIMLDKVLRQQSGYVGYHGVGGSKEKYDKFKKFLHTNHKIKPPTLILTKGLDGNIKLTLDDGRHRFAVLRDMGMKKIPVQMSEESIKIGKEAGIL